MSANKATRKTQSVTPLNSKRSAGSLHHDVNSSRTVGASTSAFKSKASARIESTKAKNTHSQSPVTGCLPMSPQSSPSVDCSPETRKDTSDRIPHFVGRSQCQLFGDEMSRSLISPTTHSKQEKKIKLLQKENEELKAELLFIKSLYRQLVEELPSEKFDERRVNLLKSKAVQLERQVLLQSSALNTRTTMLMEVENTLARIRDSLRSLCKSETKRDIEQQELQGLVILVESTRLSLYKAIQTTDPESPSLPLVFLSPFIRQTTSEHRQVSILDACSGRLEHINLKQVAKLESKLCRLYKRMMCLREVLQGREGSASKLLTCGHIGGPIRDRLSDHVTTVSQYLGECCSHLLSLSVLYPNAPWPPLKNSITPDLTTPNVMAHMPSMGKKKHQEVESVVEALMKAVSYTKHMLSLEIKILKEEVAFHQSVYELQVDYSESLLDAVRSAYQEFEKNAVKTICNPLSVILTRYSELKDNASESALRNFLSAFKDNVDQLLDAVDCLQVNEGRKTDGASALSEFGQHFFKSLNTLLREHVTKRDANMKDLFDKKTGVESHGKLPGRVAKDNGSQFPDTSFFTQVSPCSEEKSCSAQSLSSRSQGSKSCDNKLESPNVERLHKGKVASSVSVSENEVFCPKDQSSPKTYCSKVPCSTGAEDKSLARDLVHNPERSTGRHGISRTPVPQTVESLDPQGRDVKRASGTTVSSFRHDLYLRNFSGSTTEPT